MCGSVMHEPRTCKLAWPKGTHEAETSLIEEGMAVWGSVQIFADSETKEK